MASVSRSSCSLLDSRHRSWYSYYGTSPKPLLLHIFFSLFAFEQKLSPRKARQQRRDTPAAATARTSAAGLGTYEMIMGAALKTGCYDAVLAQADAARAALRDAASSSSSSGYENNSGGGGGEGVEDACTAVCFLLAC